MDNFYRIAAAVPALKVADVDFNLKEMKKLYRQAAAKHAAAVVFPELSLSSYSCGDLFFQPVLLDRAYAAARKFAAATGGTLAVFGLPLLYRDAVYNVAAVAKDGKLLGFVPKSVLPNYREFYEKRQFVSGRELRGGDFDGVPFGVDLLFESGLFRCGVEICEDLWSVLPPSSFLTLAGANVVLNLSAGTELTGKAEYRRDLVRQQSARCLCAYALAGAGVHESTTDAVFGGHAMIAFNGALTAENVRFERGSQIIYSDVDLARLSSARRSESSFNDNPLPEGMTFRRIDLGRMESSPDFTFVEFPRQPFVPPEALRQERLHEVFAIQCAGLAKRWEHTGAKKLVIGVSGGLDSTLALLAAVECCRMLKRPASDVMTVTMPGFGTTGETYDNAVKLCRTLKTDFREIPIREACIRHFDDIGHDPEVLDTTYENVQARERTQILMDLANKNCALVVGTGDLSEIALGWSTYNGDHMSMYAVNCSIPKTLIRFLIAAVAQNAPKALAKLLHDVIDTPVSPELLPPVSGKIAQKTEEIVGPYELHDFFLYHFLKYGAPVEQLQAMALAAFKGVYSAALIRNTLRTFMRRFFAQQFKRSCMPDGPKVGTIALSPRGDWRMPSDAVAELWTAFAD